jgi:hypothetical protein
MATTARPPFHALPAELAPALTQRRRELAARCTGEVLDLGGWADHLDAYRLGAEVQSVTFVDQRGDVRAGTGKYDPVGVTRVDGLPDPDQKFDSIVSLVRSPLEASADRWLAQITSRLATDGRVHLLEPVARDGRVGSWLARGARFSRRLGGLHLDRDIPARARDHGLVIIDIERFDVATVSAPLRPFVMLTARRATPGGSR